MRAAVDDAAAATGVFARVASEAFPRLQPVWADTKYHNFPLYQWLANDAAYKLEIVRRSQKSKGFVLLPHRWLWERVRVVGAFASPQ